MADYQIKIENCNSIDCADIILKKGSLNIKYGPNGLGKSTIAKAIVSQARNDGSLADKIQLLKIDLGMTEKLDSAETRKVTDPINVQLEELIKQVGVLQGSILYELFKGKASLRDRTTLMLTHDIEPAIDVIKSTANVITKFINESYHIENEYVMQLNPHKFESVPEYVVEECVRLLDAA